MLPVLIVSCAFAGAPAQIERASSSPPTRSDIDLSSSRRFCGTWVPWTALPLARGTPSRPGLTREARSLGAYSVSGVLFVETAREVWEEERRGRKDGQG